MTEQCMCGRLIEPNQIHKFFLDEENQWETECIYCNPTAFQPKPTLYELNADACWGDTCEADFWGIFDNDDPEWLKYCKDCKDASTCSSHQERLKLHPTSNLSGN